MSAELAQAGGLLTAWLLNYLLHSSILLGAAWLLTARGAIRSHLLADKLWKMALLAGLLTATLTTISSANPVTGRVHLATASPSTLQSPAVVEQGQAVTSAAAAPDRPVVAAGPTAPVASSGQAANWSEMLLALWLGGLVVAGALLISRERSLRRRLGPRDPIQSGPLREMLDELRAAAGVRHAVRLSCSGAISSPLVLGAAEICVPERLLVALPTAQQRSMLAHELAHVVRRDSAWLRFSVVLETVFFMQPLNLIGRRRMQESAEYLCDEWAVTHTGSSLDLARTLLEVANWVGHGQETRLAPAMAGSGSALVRRVERLLAAERPAEERPRRRWLLLLLGLPLLVGCGMPSLTVYPLPEDSSPRNAIPTADNSAGLDHATGDDESLFAPGFGRSFGQGFGGQIDSAEGSISIAASGTITFTSGYTAVQAISQDGSLLIEQENGDGLRKLVVEPDKTGGLRYAYTVDGVEQPYDAAAAEWLANILSQLSIIRSPGFQPDLPPGFPEKGWDLFPEIPDPSTLPGSATGAGAVATFSMERQTANGTSRVTGTLQGEVEFNADKTDVTSIAAGGSFTLAETSDGGTRKLVVTPNADGSLARVYTADGNEQQYDDAAAAWLAGVLGDVMQHIDFDNGMRPDFTMPGFNLPGMEMPGFPLPELDDEKSMDV